VLDPRISAAYARNRVLQLLLQVTLNHLVQVRILVRQLIPPGRAPRRLQIVTIRRSATSALTGSTAPPREHRLLYRLTYGVGCQLRGSPPPRDACRIVERATATASMVAL
jgi:hypothetical protein